MNPVNINIERPNFDKTNSSRNIEVMNRWISDTSDKLNYLIALINAGEIGGSDIPEGALEEIKSEIEKMQDTAFDSSDTEDGNAPFWTAVKPLETGEKNRSILEKISQMFRNVRYLFKMMGTTDISKIGDGTLTGAVSSLNAGLAKQVDKIYPVGSIYISVNSTSPADLFGGTWEQIKDRFLLADGDTYAAGSTGGEAEHTLTIDEMPKHSHIETLGDGSRPQNANQLRKMTNNEGNSGAALDVGWQSTGLGECIETWSAGDSHPHNNMPPYLAVYMWKRTA